MAPDDLDLEGLEPPAWLLRHVAHLERQLAVARRLALIAVCAALAAILVTGVTGALAIRNANKIRPDLQNTLIHNQRCDLEVRIGQSERFLDERSEEEPGLADYVREVTLPDLHKRLDALPADGHCPK